VRARYHFRNLCSSAGRGPRVTSSPAKPTNDKIGRLPVWAQNHIAILEMRAREAEAEAKRLTDNEPTRVIVDAYVDAPRYLRENSHVRFTFGERRYIDVNLDRDRNCVTIRADFALALRPMGGNTAEAFALSHDEFERLGGES
jgi:hypothetical protein